MPATGSPETSTWIAVDGRELPRLVARHPALELCNTYAGWNPADGYEREYLDGHATAVVWAGHAGVLDDGLVRAARKSGRRDPHAAAVALAELIRFRCALRDVLLDEAAPRARRTVADAVDRASTAVQLRLGQGQPTWAFAPRHGVELPLFGAAWAAAGFLTGDQRAHVRACPGRGCGWLFLDPTGRRRWCVMAVCGNREKVRRHADAHR